MAYFEQHGAMHGSSLSGSYKPAAPILKIVCDDCAQTVVPFDHSKPNGQQHWDTGWKWAPHFGASCEECGKGC